MKYRSGGSEKKSRLDEPAELLASGSRPGYFVQTSPRFRPLSTMLVSRPRRNLELKRFGTLYVADISRNRMKSFGTKKNW